MATCARCRAPLPPGAPYCGACGASIEHPGAGPRPDWRPPPQVLPHPTGRAAYRPARPARRGPRPALAAAAVLAVLTVAGAATGVILRSADRPPAPVPTVALPAPVPAPVPASPQPTPAPTPTDPVEELRRQLDGDAADVESLVGKWVPQLSSKREGDVVDGTRYDAAAILADFRGWQAKVPPVVLTRSERFTSFRGQNYYVTLAAEPFDNPDDANAWCDEKDLAPGDCFAKRLSHSEGPSGSTRPRS